MFDQAPRLGRAASEAGLTILSLGEETVRKLETIGYRRRLPQRSTRSCRGCAHHRLQRLADFVRASTDERVTQICASSARKGSYCLAATRPLPLGPYGPRCSGGTDGRALQPAAESFWRKQGYLA